MSKTEIIFILDRSGSMYSLTQDVIGGFNSLIDKQRKVDGEASVSTILFDDEIEVLHKNVDIHKIKALTENEYYVRGCTALLDAIGMTVQRTIHHQMKLDQKPDHTLLVINTDGYENASREYTYKKVSKLLKEVQQDYHWDVIFLGANIDVEAEAAKLGIEKERAVPYYAQSDGVEATYNSVSIAISDVRSNKKMRKSWRKEIDDNYKKHMKR